MTIGYPLLFRSPFKAACSAHHRKRFGAVARVYMTLREDNTVELHAHLGLFVYTVQYLFVVSFFKVFALRFKCIELL